MKRILNSLSLAACFFLVAPVWAGSEGDAFDVYIYHAKAQRDYHNGGSKDHGRLEPYEYIETVTRAELNEGLVVTFVGRDTRIRLQNQEETKCDIEMEYSLGITQSSRNGNQITVVSNNVLNPIIPNEPANLILVGDQCRSKEEAGLADDSFASLGVMAIQVNVEGYSRDTFKSKMLAAHAQQSAPLPGGGSVNTLWLTEDHVIDALNSTYGCNSCNGTAFVSPVRRNTDPVYTNGEAEYPNNALPRLAVTVTLGTSEGCAVCPTNGHFDGGATVSNESLSYRLNVGSGRPLVLKTLEPVANLRDPEVLRVPEVPGWGILRNSNDELTQIYTVSHFTVITPVTVDGHGVSSKFTIETHRVTEEPDPQESDYLHLLGPGISELVSTTTVERLDADGESVSLHIERFDREDHHHFQWESDIESDPGLDGWRETRGPQNGAQTANRKAEQRFIDNDIEYLRVVDWTLDPANGDILTRSERLNRNFPTEETEITRVVDWDNDEPVYQNQTIPSVDNWKLIEATEGFEGNTRVTTMAYYTENDGAHLAGRLKSVQHPDGNWVRIEYDAQGRRTKEVRSYLDNAFSTADSANRVTEFDYTPLGNDPGDITTTPRTVTQSVNGQVVSRRFTHIEPGITRNIRAATPAAAWDDPDNLVTTIFYANGEARVTLRPDGLISTTHTTYMGDLKTVTRASGIPDSLPVTASTQVEEGDKTVTVTHRDLDYMVFTHRYRVTLTDDILLSGHEVLDRDHEFRPLHIVHTDGTEETRTYTCCGLASETDRNGVTTTHEYDELRRRIRSTRAGLTTHTEYDAMGRVTFTWQTPENDFNAIIGKASAAPEYNEIGERIESTDPAGRVTEYERDVDNGIVTRTTTLPGGATIIEKSHADGTRIETLGTATRHLTYGESWTTAGERIVEQAYSDNPDDFTRTVHDFLGRVIRTERPSPTGTGLAVTEHHYEPGTGRLVKTVDPADLATLYFYNDLGEQHLTVVVVNNNGQIDWSGPDRIRQTETDYVIYEGHPVRETRQYVWEADGDPDPTLVSVSRRTHDGLQSWSESFGLITHSETIRDAENATLTQTTTQPDGSYSVSVTVDGLQQYAARYNADDVQLSRQDFGYDEWNRRNEVDDAGTGLTSYTFHVDGSVETVTRQPGTALEQETTTLTSGLGSLEYTSAGGRIEQVTLPDNTTVTREYYPTGELMTQFGSRQYPVAYNYDYAGRRKTLTTWQDFDGDDGKAVTTWNYNDAGVLVSKRYDDDKGPDYEYDIRGLLAKRTWARGAITEYQYDNLGQLTQVSYPNSALATPNSAFQYDRMGRLVEVQDASGTREYDYDDFQLVKETYTAGMLDNWEIGRDYDALRRPDGVDLRHLTLSVHETTYGYDQHVSRLETVTGHGHTHTYAYQDNRNLIESLDQGGVQGVTWSHDDLNRLTQIASTVDSTVISSHEYEYNDANQRNRADLADGTYWEYSYDPLGQVTGGVKKDTSDNPIPGYSFGYTYDDIGNRKTSVENGRTTDYTRNLLNQYEGITPPAFAHLRGERGNTSTTIDVELLGGGLGPREATYSNLLWYKEKAITDPVSTFEITATEGGVSDSETGSVYTPNGLNEPEFDDDGNLLKDHLWEYTWNAENRLVVQEHRDDVNISPLARTKMEFTYDSQGRRVRKIVSRWDNTLETFLPEEDLRFVYDGWNLIAEIGPLDLPVRTHVWGLDLSGTMQGAGGVGGLLGSRYHGTTSITALPFYDGNGNVMGYTDAD
ncbi:MAG: hypothetical protein LAT83_23045, partial [Kiritimatiellae bacterium]|nr:hypothetical protein [Kiritimatiellia bacterium]